MTLNVATLVTELRKFGDEKFSGFTGFPTTKAAAKTAWTNAYDNYAFTATDISGDIVISKNTAGFNSSLSFDTAGTAASSASDFDSAFISYWTGATFAVGIIPPPTGLCPNIGGTGIFGVETTSVVYAVTANVLKAKLLAVLGAPASNAQAQIELIAQAFHEATTEAVTVLITGTDTTPTPSGPLPITNTCGIS